MRGIGPLLFLSGLAAAVVAGSALRLRGIGPNASGVAASPSAEAGANALHPDSPELAVPRQDQRPAQAWAAPPEDGPEDRPAAVSSEIENAARWLRRILPEAYGGLSTSEIAALSELDLRGKDIGDADLARLAALPNLRVLGLRGTKVTDAGLAHLSGLPLSSLDLRGTGVTAFGMGCLPSASLEALHLTDTKVAGSELFRLPPMPRLAVLKLNRLEIDDDAVEALCLYPVLRHVEIDGTGISNRGLRHLLALNPGLTRIELRGTSVTKEALAELAQLYPACEFVQGTASDFRQMAGGR